MTVTDPAAPLRRRTAPANPSNLLEEIGDLLRFSGTVLRTLPNAFRYPTEILRQAGIMILSSSLILWALLLTGGVLVAEVGEYLLTAVGAQGYIGFFNSAGINKVTCPMFFGYIVAAKIGCGIVAELGSMRINEEIDAMEVMGIDSRAYLIGTRVIAWILAGPFLFLIGTGLGFVAGYVTSVEIYGTASAGAYNETFWAFTTPADLLLRSLVWAMLPTTVIILSSCYYGFTAKGGPVGVGANTARSMVVNVIVVSILGGAVLFQFFYGTGVIVPIAN
ncbi:MlaE family ABC transporter permease [Pseudonocardia sp. RS010]|uniref:MlaE family ABC transporter permease n=1 Tax=Pseudonocardia sp. RS010 TaxID=3385979 RepID=UPI00399F3130